MYEQLKLGKLGEEKFREDFAAHGLGTLTPYAIFEDEVNFGDFCTNLGINIEVKTEATNKYGNFFIEVWSNSRVRPGWVVTSGADVLVYQFWKPFKRYMFTMWNVLDYWLKVDDPAKYRNQAKHSQPNCTVGQPIPIVDLLEHVRLLTFSDLRTTKFIEKDKL